MVHNVIVMLVNTEQILIHQRGCAILLQLKLYPFAYGLDKSLMIDLSRSGSAAEKLHMCMPSHAFLVKLLCHML